MRDDTAAVIKQKFRLDGSDVLRSYDFDGLVVTTVNSLAGIRQLNVHPTEIPETTVRARRDSANDHIV